MDFAHKIASIRKEKHLSQEKFGELVNVSQRTVAAWESGERLPSLAVLDELATALHTSVDDLLDRKQKQKQSTASGELLESVYQEISALPLSSLIQVRGYLDGLKDSGQISSILQADHDPDPPSKP